MSTQPQLRPTLVTPVERRSHRRWVYIGLICAGAIIAAALFYSLEMKKIGVRVVQPTYQDIETSVSSTGVVTPVHDFQVHAAFSGIVEKIFVHVGQKVRPGQMLLHMKDQYATARLDNAQVAFKNSEINLHNAQQHGTPDERVGYEADLARAQVERDSASSAFDSLQKLEKRGSVSEAEVAAGAQRLKLAETNLQTITDRMKQRYTPADIDSLKTRLRADQDNLAAERVSWANANISSAIAGTVYIIPISQYDFVPAGGDLMHVADLSHLQVKANFYEPDIGKLEVGRPVTIQWEGAPGKSWAGKVVAKPMAVDRSGPLTVGQCIIALTSPVNDLPVNSSVSVLVQSQKHNHVLAIPRQALFSTAATDYVYRVVHGRLRKTPVKAGLVNAMSVEITSGIGEHDVIALQALDGAHLADGRRVEIAQNR